MSTSASLRRSRRASPRAHSKPVKPLPTITTEVIAEADTRHPARQTRTGCALPSPPSRMGHLMARSLGIGGWDLLRPLDVLSSMWSAAAALPPVSSGAAVAYRTLFMTVKQLVVGRTLNVRLDSGEMTLTVTEFDSRLDVRRLAVGQLNDVRLTAADIRWERKVFQPGHAGAAQRAPAAGGAAGVGRRAHRGDARDVLGCPRRCLPVGLSAVDRPRRRRRGGPAAPEPPARAGCAGGRRRGGRLDAVAASRG